MIPKVFYSKLLLFGEYAVLDGGSALAFPYREYSGRIDFAQKAYQKEVYDFTNYLLEQNFDFLSNSKLQELITRKAGFSSNIPIGAGLGSSGVVSAAFYHWAKLDDHDMLLIDNKARLAQIESYFHGDSSGFDPTVSYYDQILLASANGIRPIQFTLRDTAKPLHIYLLDTQIERDAQQYIKRYIDHKSDDQFQALVTEQYLPLQRNCIKRFLAGASSHLWLELRALSQFQLKHLTFLIPDAYLDYWQKGIDTNKYYCKLCGAGGGGFILVFAKAEIENSQENLRLINEYL